MNSYMKLSAQNWHGVPVTIGLARHGRQDGAVTLVIKQEEKNITVELTEFDRRKIIEWLSK